MVAVGLDHRLDLPAIADQGGLRTPALVTVRGWQLLVADPLTTLRSLDQLDRYAAAVGWRGSRPDGPPFRGGAVGFVSDDLSPGLLSLPPDTRAAVAPLPTLRFTVHDWCLAVDPEGRGWVVAPRDRLGDLRALARTAGEPEAGRPPRGIATAGLDRAAHGAAVSQILEWIAAGDLYQANLTFQIRAAWDGTAADLARALGGASPGAAHAALLCNDDGTAIVSVSPETFLRTDGDTVTTRPIKGTRRRHRDPRDDVAAADQLRTSVKDHAEHVMIVDLERNDLGRVCVPGSVRVWEYAALEPHPTVWHLTSTVAGRLRPEVGLADVVRATFPPGSVTGTPKRMAVARTRLLEPVRRGVYCGAIGMVGPGVLDLSVAIRTAVLSDGVASYGAGGAIVADSDAGAEYAEALDKAAAFLTATNAVLYQGDMMGRP